MLVGQTMVGLNPAVQNIKHVLLSVVDARVRDTELMLVCRGFWSSPSPISPRSLGKNIERRRDIVLSTPGNTNLISSCSNERYIYFGAD
jgi:hypothetical protein